MKEEGSLFVLTLKSPKTINTFCHTLDTIQKPLMRVGMHQVGFRNVLNYDGQLY
jgi:hypothetical protein